MATKLKKDWRYYIGITFLILSLVLPLFGFLIPFLDLPVALTTVIIGGLTLGGPELMIMLAAFFLGKKYFSYLKGKIRRFFKKKHKPKPVSKTRYYIGLTLFLLSPIPLYLSAYTPEILPSDEDMRLILFVIFDIVFVVSFFILGDHFWEKFKSLFIWDDPKKQGRVEEKKKVA